MNWVCKSCGYENEYNDESQPTECLCCGEPASEHLLNQARRALDEFHKEQERQRHSEQLRLEAIRWQEKIERSIKSFIKGVRTLATACIVFMVLSVGLAGFNVYKGNITPKYVPNNVKSITIVDNMMASVNVISDNLSETVSGLTNNIVQNVSYTSQNKNYAAAENMKRLAAGNKERIEVTVLSLKRTADGNKETMMATVSGLKEIGGDFTEGYERRRESFAISQSNVSYGYNNLIVNSKLCWTQATQNVNQLINSISKKFGRTK